MGWFSLPDKEIEVRETREGAFWRHKEDNPCPGGEGPYPTLEDAAKDGEDYANFIHGR